MSVFSMVNCFCTPVTVLSKCFTRIGKGREEFLVSFYVNSLHVELKKFQADKFASQVYGIEFKHAKDHLFTNQVTMVFPENGLSSTLVFTEQKLPKVISVFFRNSSGCYDKKIWFIRLFKINSDNSTVVASTSVNVSNFIRADPKMSEVLVLLDPVCDDVESVSIKIAVSTLKIKCGLKPPIHCEYDDALAEYRSMKHEQNMKIVRERKLQELRIEITEWLRESLEKYNNIGEINIIQSFENGIIINALLDCIFPNTVNFELRYDEDGNSKERYTDFENLMFSLDYFSKKGVDYKVESNEMFIESDMLILREEIILDYYKKIKELFGDKIARKSTTTIDEPFLLCSDVSSSLEKSASITESVEQLLYKVPNILEEFSSEDDYIRKYYRPDPVSILNQTIVKGNMESSFYEELRTSKFNSMNKPKINYVNPNDTECYAEDLIADSRDSVFTSNEMGNTFDAGGNKTFFLTESLESNGSFINMPQFSFSDMNITIDKNVDETQREGYYGSIRKALEDIRKKIGEYSDRREQVTSRFDSLKIFLNFLPDYEKRSYGMKDDDLFMKLYTKGRNQEIAMEYVNRTSTQKVLESIHEKFTSHLIINKKLEDYIYENCKSKTVTSDSVMNDLLFCLLNLEQLCKEAEHLIYLVPGVKRDYDPDIFIRHIDSELTYLSSKSELKLEDRDRESFLLCQRQRLVDLKSALIEKDFNVSERNSVSQSKYSINGFLNKLDEFRKTMM